MYTPNWSFIPRLWALTLQANRWLHVSSNASTQVVMIGSSHEVAHTLHLGLLTLVQSDYLAVCLMKELIGSMTA